MARAASKRKLNVGTLKRSCAELFHPFSRLLRFYLIKCVQAPDQKPMYRTRKMANTQKGRTQRHVRLRLGTAYISSRQQLVLPTFRRESTAIRDSKKCWIRTMECR